MRHQNVNKKLGREKGPRNSLFRATATNLLNHESINTTLAKAKATRSYIEKMITKAKNGTLHDMRNVAKEIHDKDVIGKLFNDIAKRFEKRNGGYTRIIKTGPRKNDGAEMAIFELVEKKEKVSPKVKKADKKAVKAVKKTDRKYNEKNDFSADDKKMNTNKMELNSGKDKKKDIVRKVIA